MKHTGEGLQVVAFGANDPVIKGNTWRPNEAESWTTSSSLRRSKEICEYKAGNTQYAIHPSVVCFRVKSANSQSRMMVIDRLSRSNLVRVVCQSLRKERKKKIIGNYDRGCHPLSISHHPLLYVFIRRIKSFLRIIKWKLSGWNEFVY